MSFFKDDDIQTVHQQILDMENEVEKLANALANLREKLKNKCNHAVFYASETCPDDGYIIHRQHCTNCGTIIKEWKEDNAGSSSK